MKYIEELLQGAEVEWKPLGEVAEIVRGVRVTKNQLKDHGYPVVSGGIGYMGYLDKYNREANTITIAQYGTAGYVNLQTERFWANDVCFSVFPKKQIANKYLYYVLNNKQEYLYSISNRIAVPYSISRARILKILIPLPPLAVQEEIIRILDKFTTLEAELEAKLEAELEARISQHRYYRDLLLSFDDADTLHLPAFLRNVPIEWKPLGEVAEIRIENRKRRPVKATERIPGEIPYYGANNIQDHVEGFTHNGEYILLAEDGSKSLSPYSVQWATGRFWANNHVHVLKAEGGLRGRFLYHYLLVVNYVPYLMGGDRPKLTKGNLERIPIPILYPGEPEKSLAIQERIVEILDRFEKLTTSLTEGLPREIELRRKQYEYYRDQLLSF